MTSSGRGAHPFVGPQPFRRDDATKFFGRDHDIDELTKAWLSHRLTILHGPPGAGKTSLVHAGLLPRLDPSRVDVLPVGQVRWPSAVPAAVLPEDSDPHVLALLASWSPYENPIRFAGLTVRSYLRRHHWSPYSRPILAVLDHAEDLFTDVRHRPGGHARILDQLGDVLADDLPLHLLVVVSDEYAECLRRHEGLKAHITRGASYKLEPLRREEALEACRRPLDGAGRNFAPGTAERLVDALTGSLPELSRPDSPDPSARRTGAEPAGPAIEPLHLQLVGAALWEAVRWDDGPITDDDLPDVDDVLAAHCRRILREVAREHLDGDVEHLLALVRPLAESEGPDREEPPPRIAAALVARHLLRFGDKGRYEVPARLAGPFLRAASAAPSTWPAEAESDVTDRLAAAESALHRGWFDLVRWLVTEEMRDPSLPRSRAQAESLLGDVAYLNGDLDAALAHYREASRLFDALRGTDQIVATLLTAIGRILMDQNAYRTAVSELRSAVRRCPEPVIQTQLAWALWYQGQESGAMDMLEGALRAGGDDTPEALRARGEILSDLSDPRALDDLKRVPRELASTQAAYALALAREGELRQAVEAVPPLGAKDDATTLLRAARVMAAAGRHEEAARLAHDARSGRGRRPLPPQLTAEADRLMAS
ncbi:tetratricopeptide repeat protein [Nonomuraea sp. NPDC049309]|uniref:tetratricopeptide repeat protein n=1 Tax=Nonomuraea sp. NPDC049309 TaxID=3364350 RepID=UPI003721AF58